MSHDSDTSLNDDLFKGCFDSESENEAPPTIVKKNICRQDVLGVNYDANEGRRYMSKVNSDLWNNECKNNVYVNNLTREIVSVVEDAERFQNVTANLPYKNFNELSEVDARKNVTFNKTFEKNFSRTTTYEKSNSGLLTLRNDYLCNNNLGHSKAVDDTTQGDESTSIDTCKKKGLSRKANVSANVTLTGEPRFTHINPTRHQAVVVYSSDEDDDFDKTLIEQSKKYSKVEKLEESDENKLIESDKFISGLPIMKTKSFDRASHNFAITKVAAKWETQELFAGGCNLTCATSLRKKFYNKIPPSVFNLEGDNRYGIVYEKKDGRFDLATKSYIFGRQRGTQALSDYELERDYRNKMLNLDKAFERRIKDILIERNDTLCPLYTLFAQRKKNMESTQYLELHQFSRDPRSCSNYEIKIDNLQEKHSREMNNLAQEFESGLLNFKEHFQLRILSERRRRNDMKNEVDALYQNYSQVENFPIAFGVEFDVFTLAKNSKRKLRAGESESDVVYVPKSQGHMMRKEDKLYDKKYGYA